MADSISLITDGGVTATDLFGAKIDDEPLDVPGMGDTVTLCASEEMPARGFGIEIALQIVVQIGEKVAEGLLTSWLLDKLTHRARYIRYRGESYDITVTDLNRLIKRLKRQQHG